MNTAATMAELSAYTSPADREALETRLKHLAAVGPDESCATYFDLRPPSVRSPLHARTTHLLADSLVNGRPPLPLPMDTVVPTRWRLLVSAGMGRVRDVGLLLSPSPAAAPHALLDRVCSVLAQPRELSDSERTRAGQILLRLGAKRSILELHGVGPATDLLARVREDASPSEAVGISFIRDGTSDALEEAALARGADPTLEISERVRLVRFVLVRRGKARQAVGDRLYRAYQLGMSILQDVTVEPADAFVSAMLSSTLHRALAFQPFLAGEAETALQHLLEADRLLAELNPEDTAMRLLLQDHHYPALETLSRTASLLAHHQMAMEAAHRLVTLDPYDARSWFALGKALIAQGDLLSAGAAFAAAASCELAQRARACYYAAVTYGRAGSGELARQWLDRSASLDPTPAALVNVGRAGR